MPSYREIFPSKWLKADMIEGKRPRVVVERVTVENLYNPSAKKNENKLVAAFRGKELRLILNQTQCKVLEAMAGTDDYTRWRGLEVYLSPAKAANGKDTILVTPASGNLAQPELIPDDQDTNGEVDFGMGKTAPKLVHGQEVAPEFSGARPGELPQQSAATSAARPVNIGADLCPHCHAPAGKPHAKKCPLAVARPEVVHGQAVAQEVVARPQALPVHGQEIFDMENQEDASARPGGDDPIAGLSESGLLSSKTADVVRRARNADSDSSINMSDKYYQALTATLTEYLDASAVEADMMLTALLGKKISPVARPGTLVHNFLIKPLREYEDTMIEALVEILEFCRVLIQEDI